MSYAGGLLEVEGRIIWGRGEVGGVFWLDENSGWERMSDVDSGARLAVCEGKFVCVGGYKDHAFSKKVMMLRGEEWTLMPDMLLGCVRSCVVGVGGERLIVMGGKGDRWRDFDDVQIYDGKEQIWHKGPSLPERCWAMSSIVHGDLIFVMGGEGMDRKVWCANVNDLVSTCTCI